MRIMLVNDDGIRAPGIWALYDELRADNDVIVCAPRNQCSGFSHSVTIRSGLVARRYARGDAEAYEIDGTPADCTLLGLNALAGGPVDLVISGINDGYNAAGDVHYSGTIGAACEACTHGVPALAVSTDSGNFDYSQTLYYMRSMLETVPLDRNTGLFYSLNVPAGRVQGLRRAPLDVLAREAHYELAGRDGDAGRYEYRRSVVKYLPDGDLDMLSRGWATWTALGCDWTR